MRISGPDSPDRPLEGADKPPESIFSSGSGVAQILENLPLPVLLATLEEIPRVVFLNRQFTATFGYTREDIPTKEDWARLAYPDEGYRREVFGKWDQAVARAVEEKGSVEAMEFRVVAKDGSIRDVLFNASVYHDLLQVTLTDITARRKAERELGSARVRLEQVAYDLTANIPVGTYVLKFEKTGAPCFTFLSERWLGMLDLRREDVLADPSLAFNAVHPDERDDFNKLNAAVFAERKPFLWEGRIIVRGETRWVAIESIPREPPDGGTVWEGVMTDITRRKTAELELAALRERERQNEARQRADLERKLRSSLAAAAAAHEINQPLARILLTSQVVLENQRARATGDPKLSGFLRELASEAQSVVSTIEKMKSLMRNTETACDPLEMRGIVDSAILYAGSFAREAGVEVSFERPAHPFEMRGDANQIQIAINNLIRNAIESFPGVGREAARVVRLRLQRREAGIALCVEDSGPGLPFANIGDTLLKSTKHGGSGLGLFIVRTTMENHGGVLDVGRSDLGGAEFRMIFPIDATKKPEAGSSQNRGAGTPEVRQHPS